MQGPPFGIIVPGQPPQFSFTQISNAQWVMNMDGCPGSFLFFLTMSEPLPAGYGLGIYATSNVGTHQAPDGYPAGGNEGGFMLLGAVTAGKPSSLFEVPSSLLPSTEQSVTATGSPAVLTVGVCLETEDVIANVLGEGTGASTSRFNMGAVSSSSSSAAVLPGNAFAAPPQGASMHATAQGAAVYKRNNATKYAIGERVLEDFCMFVSSYVKSVSVETLPAIVADLSATVSQSGQSVAAVEYVMMPVNFVDGWRQRLLRMMKAGNIPA